MQKITIRNSLYLAFVEYCGKQKTLITTNISGKRFRFSNFEETDFENLQQANNKGNYIAINVESNNKFKKEFLGMASPEVINQSNKRQAL